MSFKNNALRIRLAEGSKGDQLHPIAVSAVPVSRVNRPSAAGSMYRLYVETSDLKPETILKCHVSENRGKFGYHRDCMRIKGGAKNVPEIQAVLLEGRV